MAQKHFGRFTKGDREKVAHSQAAAVRLRFEGWAEKTQPTKAARKELEEAVAGGDTSSSGK